MAKYTINDTTLTSIADAIRAKGGTSAALTPSQMAEAIAAIQAGGGGGANEILGQEMLSGSFVLTEDVSANGIAQFSYGIFEQNTSYTIFMCPLIEYNKLIESLGTSSVMGSLSINLSEKNPANESAALCMDRYGNRTGVKGVGLLKNYANDYLTFYATSSYKIKAGVEYYWIAVREDFAL